MKKIAIALVLTFAWLGAASAYGWEGTGYGWYESGAYGPGHYYCGFRGFRGGWGYARCWPAVVRERRERWQYRESWEYREFKRQERREHERDERERYMTWRMWQR